jgi:hypothetical protein
MMMMNDVDTAPMTPMATGTTRLIIVKFKADSIAINGKGVLIMHTYYGVCKTAFLVLLLIGEFHLIPTQQE